jgi:hypothetical protein
MGRTLVLRDMQILEKVSEKDPIVDQGVRYRIFKVKNLILQRGMDFVYQATVVPV